MLRTLIIFWYLLLFHDNNSYVNASQRYVISTLSNIFMMKQPNSDPGHLAFQVSRSHTVKKHKHGWNPPNEWSAQRTGRYLHNTQPTQETNIHAVTGIRTPTFPAFEWPQTYALAPTATRISHEPFTYLRVQFMNLVYKVCAKFCSWTPRTHFVCPHGVCELHLRYTFRWHSGSCWQLKTEEF